MKQTEPVTVSAAAAAAARTQGAMRAGLSHMLGEPLRPQDGHALDGLGAHCDLFACIRRRVRHHPSTIEPWDR